MGRRRVTISPVNDPRSRSVTFVKRRQGLVKKAYELAVLCQCEVAMVLFFNGRCMTYATGGGAEGIRGGADAEGDQAGFKGCVKRWESWEGKPVEMLRLGTGTGAGTVTVAVPGTGMEEEEEEEEEQEEGGENEDEGRVRKRRRGWGMQPPMGVSKTEGWDKRVKEGAPSGIASIPRPSLGMYHVQPHQREDASPLPPPALTPPLSTTTTSSFALSTCSTAATPLSFLYPTSASPHIPSHHHHHHHHHLPNTNTTANNTNNNTATATPTTTTTTTITNTLQCPPPPPPPQPSHLPPPHPQLYLLHPASHTHFPPFYHPSHPAPTPPPPPPPPTPSSPPKASPIITTATTPNTTITTTPPPSSTPFHPYPLSVHPYLAHPASSSATASAPLSCHPLLNLSALGLPAETVVTTSRAIAPSPTGNPLPQLHALGPYQPPPLPSPALPPPILTQPHPAPLPPTSITLQLASTSSAGGPAVSLPYLP